MAFLTFPTTPAGLALPVYVGVDQQTAVAHLASSQPVPSLLPTWGLVDTGSDLTAVAPWVLQQHNLPVIHTVTTQTASGAVHVHVHSVSLSITDPNRSGSPTLTVPFLLVTQLATTLADADVLVGLNLLLQYKLLLDGPSGEFTLEF
jgi:hypothetical protein